MVGMTDKNHKKNARKLATTSVLPFAILLMAILAAIFLTVVGMANRTSDTADERIRSLLLSSFSEEVNDVARNLHASATLDIRQMPAVGGQSEVAARLAKLERIRALGGFDAVAFVRKDGAVTDAVSRLVFGQEHPGARHELAMTWAASQLANNFRSGQSTEEGNLVGRYGMVDDSLNLVAAVIVKSPVARAELIGIVGVKSLDQVRLASLGDRLSIRSLRFAEGPAGTARNALAVPYHGNGTVLHVTWESERPGDPILKRLYPIAIFSILAITIFAWLSFTHVTRVTHSMLASEAKAQHMAGHDTLSGLPNRHRFTEHLRGTLSRLERNEKGIAVLFVDLDKFKDVNDTFGHTAGDYVIRECAERMATQLRVTDILARFGGDEFAIIQTDVGGPIDSELLARRLIEAIRPAFRIGDKEAYIGASIGIALAPQDSKDAAELMRLADIAMYRAKHGGRNRACFFEQQMEDTLRVRKVVEDELRQAIQNDQLELYYQPQATADGLRIGGVEALIRWKHPVLGFIPPSDFIPIAEERGLIVELGAWVVRRACMDTLQWGDIPVACNVSAIQFRQPDFVESVFQILEETNFPASRLELELTEGVVVADADQAEQSIMDLRSAGIKLALDDFGTGYSSLIYLRRFAFDKIKLDKSFLDSLEDAGESAILVHSVVHLGRALGLTVTAEGVETAEQRRFLQAVGCHLLQGYFFSRPVPKADFEAILARKEPFRIEKAAA
jgi:diguanylate cyclase